MKKNLLFAICASLNLLAFTAEAQAPASFHGAAIYLSGYKSVVTIANNANSFQRVNWITGVPGSGNFTYAQSNSDALLAVNDSNLGAFSADYNFASASGGTYAFTHTVSAPPFQAGSFTYYSGTAPAAAALVGALVTETITSGNTNSDSSGTFSIAFISSTLANVTDTGGVVHSEAYSVSTVNQSTIKVNTTLPGLNSASLYLSYGNSTSGGFVVHSLTSGWQIGTFTMQAAPDTTRPTVTITTPVANAHLSNQMATVTGKASDNVSVASAWVSSDGVNWLTATGTTNWTAAVPLNPGANTILAYAVDTSGNVSLTNKVNVTYIVSAVLTVQTNQPGWGTVSPSYNNTSLQISNTYTITATAKPGFAFTNWTDGGTVLTNKPTLKFTMESNLVFIANFVDVQKPTISITNIPVSGKVSNDTFTVKGKAGDNVGVASVWYNLNNGGWSNIGMDSSNNFTNWNVDLTLLPGLNTIAAYAVDAAGNVSLTNTVRVTYIVSALLTVSINGRGTVAPNYNNAFLQISNHYTMTATPAAGFGFTGWTDGHTLVTTNKILSFTMASNLVFVANFVDTQKPTVTILTPVATTSASSEMFLARGTAGDNVGVQTVFFKFNQFDWFPASTTNLNYYTNWNELVQLVPGTNYFAAYAVDAAGNVSPTNTVKFLYTTAPASLNGLIAGITPTSLTPAANAIAVGGSLPNQFVAFGAATFSQWASDTNAGDNGVGNYTYTKQTPSSGQLKITYTAPPSATNAEGAQTIHLTFTAPNVATFTNLTTTGMGGIMFTSTPTLAPVSFVGQTVYAVNSQGADKLRFTANQIIGINSQGLTNHIRNYTYASYSPVGGLIRQTGSNYLSYTVITFARTNIGGAYSEKYDSSNNLAGVDLSEFGLASQRPGGNAPTNLVNRTVVVTTDNGANQLNFTDSVNFTDVNPLDNSVVNGVGTYTYGPPSTNSASLNLTYSSSPAVPFDFLFVSPNFAIFTNSLDSTIGSAVLK